MYDLRDVEKSWITNNVGFRITIPRLRISRGEKIALIGDSGSGKSTLLDMLAFISRPTSSTFFHFNPETDSKALDISKTWQNGRVNTLSKLRKQHIGYVMQTGGLLPYLTVKDNINLSRSVLGLPDDNTVLGLARELKIERHLNMLPGGLSIGERQRVAIGRALAHRPAVVIADEPTASLDPYSAKSTMNLFVELADEFGVTLIIASHAWGHLRKYGLKALYHQTLHFADSTEATVSG